MSLASQVNTFFQYEIDRFLDGDTITLKDGRKAQVIAQRGLDVILIQPLDGGPQEEVTRDQVSSAEFSPENLKDETSDPASRKDKDKDDDDEENEADTDDDDDDDEETDEQEQTDKDDDEEEDDDDDKEKSKESKSGTLVGEVANISQIFLRDDPTRDYVNAIPGSTEPRPGVSSVGRPDALEPALTQAAVDAANPGTGQTAGADFLDSVVRD